MIKERKFKVHPEVLSCLSHLRLRSELGVRSSDSKADKPAEQGAKKYANNRAAQRRAKGKATDQPHLSKKARKAMKERQEIQKEMREAEAEVDKEERAAVVRFSVFQTHYLTPCSLQLCSVVCLSVAYRNPQTSLRALFPHSQKSRSHAVAASRPGRHIKICAFGQHRFFQRSYASAKRTDVTRIDDPRRFRNSLV